MLLPFHFSTEFSASPLSRTDLRNGGAVFPQHNPCDIYVFLRGKIYSKRSLSIYLSVKIGKSKLNKILRSNNTFPSFFIFSPDSPTPLCLSFPIWPSFNAFTRIRCRFFVGYHYIYPSSPFFNGRCSLPFILCICSALSFVVSCSFRFLRPKPRPDCPFEIRQPVRVSRIG